MAKRPPPRPVAAREAGHQQSGADRGASEVVSFILTFSIITMMIGILYTAGFVSLQQLQTGNQMDNAESVFFAVADSFGELQEGQAPKRAGSLDLDVGASVAVVNQSEITVAVNNATGTPFSATLTTRSLDYQLEKRAVVYESGAVFRSNDGNSAMVREPAGIFCSPAANSSVISVVTLIDPDGASTAAGTATVTGLQRSTKLLYPSTRNTSVTGDIQNVTIEVTSPHGDAWRRYLTESTGWADPDGDGTYTCESADSVFVRRTVVEVHVDG